MTGSESLRAMQEEVADSVHGKQRWKGSCILGGCHPKGARRNQLPPARGRTGISTGHCQDDKYMTIPHRAERELSLSRERVYTCPATQG